MGSAPKTGDIATNFQNPVSTTMIIHATQQEQA